VMKALAKRREDRYESAREMQSDLESFVREERIPVSPVSMTKWMQSLFAEKLAQQKEALQDIKQLADVIAQQQGDRGSMYEGTLTTGTGTGMMSAPGASSSIRPPPKRGVVGVVVGVVAAAALAGGVFFYMKKVAADAQANQAALQAAAPPPKVAAVEEAKGWIEIKTHPEGCAIWVNGDLRQEVTPARVENLPFGRELKLKLTKEGLEAHRETITLTAESPSKFVTAEMQAGSVTLLIKVEPPPTMWLDGKQWKGDRNKIDGVSADEEHKLVMSANGFMAKTITFTAKSGETRMIQERLVKADPNAAAQSGPDKPAAEKPDPETKPAAAAGGSGKVRVGAKGGYCNVTINGASYGATPIEAVVPAGNVRVSCKPPTGPTQSQAVKVGAGETARVGFKIE